MMTASFNSTPHTTELMIDVDLYLHHYDNQYAIRVLPAIFLLSSLMVVGFVGNSLVCYIYLFRISSGTSRCFISALAIFDLISCTISIPLEIVDLRHSYTFGRHAMCKAARVIVAFSSTSSGLILVAVAVDRYKKICRALESQITPNMSMVAITICSSIALAISSPAAIMFGSSTHVTDNLYVNGSDCSTADQYVHTAYPLIFNGVQFLVFIGATATLTVLYILIWKQIRKQLVFRESTTRRSLPELSKGYKFSLAKSDSEVPLAKVSEDEPEPDQRSNRHQSDRTDKDEESGSKRKHSTPHYARSGSSNGDVVGKRNSGKKAQVRSVEMKIRKTTFTLFLVTLVFVLSYLPYLGLMATRAVKAEVFQDLGNPAENAYHLFLRSYFINSVVNPIIYSVTNLYFRREVKILIRKLTCRG